MPLVGSFAGASARAYGLGAGVALPGNFESIATTTLSSNQSTVTFSSIPQTYLHLQLRCSILGSVAAGNSAKMQFNGDTATNYSYHYLYGNGAIVASVSGTTQDSGYIEFTGNTTSPSANIMDILDYANTNKYKTVKGLEVFDMNGPTGYVSLNSFNWRSTAAITSIVVTAFSGTLNTNSIFALYGVKA